VRGDHAIHGLPIALGFPVRSSAVRRKATRRAEWKEKAGIFVGTTWCRFRSCQLGSRGAVLTNLPVFPRLERRSFAYAENTSFISAPNSATDHENVTAPAPCQNYLRCKLASFRPHEPEGMLLSRRPDLSEVCACTFNVSAALRGNANRGLLHIASVRHDRQRYQ
jgi:hypothetical protein